MRVGWVVIICSPFMEVIGDVVTTGVGRCVLEINDDVAVMRRSPWRWIVQLEQVTILRIIVCVISSSFIPSQRTHGQRQLGRPRQ